MKRAPKLETRLFRGCPSCWNQRKFHTVPTCGLLTAPLPWGSWSSESRGRGPGAAAGAALPSLVQRHMQPLVGATTETQGAQAGKSSLSKRETVPECRGLRVTRASSSWADKCCAVTWPFPCLLPQAFGNRFGWAEMPFGRH